LTDEELAHYSGAGVSLAELPLVIVAGSELSASATLIDRLSASPFRFLVTLDSKTFVDSIAALRPDIVIVGPATPTISMADLAEIIWTNRLDATVIVIGRHNTLLPTQFNFLDIPVTTEALWSVLNAAGYEER
jgi:hypothetical protein